MIRDSRFKGFVSVVNSFKTSFTRPEVISVSEINDFSISSIRLNEGLLAVLFVSMLDETLCSGFFLASNCSSPQKNNNTRFKAMLREKKTFVTGPAFLCLLIFVTFRLELES